MQEGLVLLTVQQRDPGWMPDSLRPPGSGQAEGLGAELCDSHGATFLITGGSGAAVEVSSSSEGLILNQ